MRWDWIPWAPSLSSGIAAPLCACFTLLCAALVAQSCPNVCFPKRRQTCANARTFCWRYAWELCRSLRRDRRTWDTRGKRASSGMQRRPKWERRSAKIKPLLIFSPPPILFLFCCVLAPPKVIPESQPGRIFQRRRLYVYFIHVCYVFTHLFLTSWRAKTPAWSTADGNQWKETNYRAGSRPGLYTNAATNIKIILQNINNINNNAYLGWQCV